MPKQVQKFARFEGGVNEGSDPRDISENELVKSDNVTVDDLGKLRLIGKADSTAIHTFSAKSINPGYGLFSYSTDYDAAGGENNTDWVAVLNEGTGQLQLRHTTGGTSVELNDVLDAGGDDDDTRAEFYFANGAIRVAQGNLSKTKTTQWYGYLKEDFYHTTDVGNGVSEVSKWDLLNAAPAVPPSLTLHDSTASNPNATAIGATAGDKVVLSYWKSANGGWAGVYQFGYTFVYKGGAESVMTKSTTKVTAHEEKLSFQVYIPIGTNSVPGADFGNGFGDDRIVGLNLYFKEFDSNDFNLLESIDFIKGGENHWLKITAATHLLYGIFESGGSVEVAAPATTTENDVADHYSYADTTCAVTIDNDASGFTGRKGYVRLIGSNVSPLYIDAPSNLGDGVVTFPAGVFKNGGPGTRVLKAELLDESFNVLKESEELEYTIVDSGREAPPSFEHYDPSS